MNLFTSYKMGFPIVLTSIGVLCTGAFFSSSGSRSSSSNLVFEETLIEGKIKRPQVVMISADQRPKFSPMAINNFEDSTSLLEKVDPAVFEQNRYEDVLDLRFRRGK